MNRKYILAYILMVLGSQFAFGQSNLDRFAQLESLEKEKKHLLDSLKEDFKAKLKDLKLSFELEYADSSEELMDELYSVFKKEKKKLKWSYKTDKKSVKTSTYKRRRKIQELENEEVPITIEVEPITISNRNGLLNEAEKHIGTPYKHGGLSKKGFDCSGFVKYVYSKQGIDLPRVSSDQANSGKSISVSKTEPGDLLFFSHGGGKIDHVGIVLKNKGEKLEMIHASSSKGVIKTDVNSSSYWKRRLKKARRVN